ncbi:MAG: MSMEG_6728 family protein [Candidatus Neomarinimicrobiota bacterium]
MQTFLPYPTFQRTVEILDDRRLGKQRVEALQIYRALTVPGYGWARHPAVKMWYGHEAALLEYKNTCIREWVRRGFKNTMELSPVPDEIVYPRWLGDEEFHAAHRSNLLRKDGDYYRRFNWIEAPDLPYVWPG